MKWTSPNDAKRLSSDIGGLTRIEVPMRPGTYIQESPAARASAGLIAAAAWTGLAVQWALSLGVLHTIARTLWVVLGYFTITTNLLIAVLFTGIAFGFRTRASVVAGTAVSIMLVGAVYSILLAHLFHFHGSFRVANTLLHQVTPIVVPLFWLAFVPKGTLTWRAPLIWVLYPLLYLPYALLRGRYTQNYAYPFIDLHRLGWPPVLFNSAALAACFILAGYLFVGIDRTLATQKARSLAANASVARSSLRMKVTN